MRKGTPAWLVAVLIALAVPAGASPGPADGLESAFADSARDRAIRRAFDDVLDREPTSSELRRYRDLMEDEGWSEKDVRDDLRRRESRSGDRDTRDVERVIRRAYQDILDREPDRDGMRLYRSRMIDDGWSEKDVRDALRKSPEYRTVTRENAQETVRKAYLSVLGREPDAGSSGYVNKVMRERWSQADVERELRKSPEYRNKSR
jgi:hypothetical protein